MYFKKKLTDFYSKMKFFVFKILWGNYEEAILSWELFNVKITLYKI